MRYVIALVAIAAGAVYVFGSQGGSTDELRPKASVVAVPSESNASAQSEAFPHELAAESRAPSDSIADAALFEQRDGTTDQLPSASSTETTFDLGTFIDPDDMSTWPEGEEVIVGEYIDPDEFFADEQPPVEIGEWIDPDVEYGSDLSDPVEIGDYEDPDNPTPSEQQPVEVGEFVDPDNPGFD